MTTLENFITFCDEMQIAEEGLLDRFKSKDNSIALSEGVKRVEQYIESNKIHAVKSSDANSIIVSPYMKDFEMIHIQQRNERYSKVRTIKPSSKYVIYADTIDNGRTAKRFFIFVYEGKPPLPTLKTINIESLKTNE